MLKVLKFLDSYICSVNGEQFATKNIESLKGIKGQPVDFEKLDPASKNRILRSYIKMNRAGILEANEKEFLDRFNK